MLFIIYIFALFVITSPNVFFNLNKDSRMISAIIHAAIFTLIMYVTKDIIFYYREEMVIGTIENDGKTTNLKIPDGIDLSSLITPDVEVEPEEVVITNTVLDYGDYKHPRGEFYPLPGPLPSIYDDIELSEDSLPVIEGFKLDIDGINSIKKIISEFNNVEPIKIKINNRVEEPVVKTIRHSIGPEEVSNEIVGPE